MTIRTGTGSVVTDRWHASEASGRVDEAVVTAAHWVPPPAFDATVEVRVFGRGMR